MGHEAEHHGHHNGEHHHPVEEHHKVLPLIESPFKECPYHSEPDRAHFVFKQRHEASSLELFFDLFFVANLATFTAYHAVVDLESLYAYVGFFAFLWCTWFQITLHDCRFARDSWYERICKIIQMSVFVAFALVGSQFNPGTPDASSTNFRILTFTLFMSRLQFVIQHIIVIIYCFKEKARRLILPIGMITLAYAACAIVFATLSIAYRRDNIANAAVYSAWWICMSIESVTVIAISITWRNLSFKKTHLLERMDLLTLIVIGEGAIGVTKTISRMTSKNGLDAEGTGLVFCIILILVFLWTIYFDNPHRGHFGTIRQQIWAIIHFPLHLGIVGVVEGSQQVALARYVFRNVHTFGAKLVTYCGTLNYEGDQLKKALTDAVSYFQLDYATYTYGDYLDIQQIVANISAKPDICSPMNANNPDTMLGLDPAFDGLANDLAVGVFRSLGISIPSSFDYMHLEAAFMTLYIYWFTAVAAVILCFLILYILVRLRRDHHDPFKWISVFVRCFMLMVPVIFLALYGQTVSRNNIDHTISVILVRTPTLVPICTAIFFVIIIFDQISNILANRHMTKSRGMWAPVSNPSESTAYERSSFLSHDEEEPKKSTEVGIVEVSLHEESHDGVGSRQQHYRDEQ